MLKSSPILICTVCAAVLVLSICKAPARDFGQWDGLDPLHRKWFDELMRPDEPDFRCCGLADAYWADILRASSLRRGAGRGRPRSMLYVASSFYRSVRPRSRIGNYWFKWCACNSRPVSPYSWRLDGGKQDTHWPVSDALARLVYQRL